MAEVISVGKRRLQNYLINRSFLAQKADSILEVLEKLKCIQVDPINVVARSHELALWNRVRDFRLEDLSTHLYKSRLLFEYWLQLFSIIPVRYYPYLAHRMKMGGRWQEEYRREHQQLIKKTLEFVREHGVTASGDLAHMPRAGSLLSWSDSTRTAILEYLWDTGKIMIHHREKNQKFYDLTERILPKAILGQKVGVQESREFFLGAAFDYVGVVRRVFADHVTHRLGYVETFAVDKLWDRWLADGRIVELAVSGVKTRYFVLKRQLDKMERSGGETRHGGLNILSPLDPLIIDRKLVRDIFDFDYTWEAYTPRSKRKFGYYGMPILYRGKLVGQLDARRDREGRLRILKCQTTDGSAEFKKDLGKAVRGIEALGEDLRSEGGSKA